MWWVSLSWGCSLMAPPPWEVDASIDDDVAPALVDAWVDDIQRGRGPRGNMRTSCDDLGFITVVTESDEPVGLMLEPSRGTLPQGLTLGGIVEGPGVTLTWIDEATDEQEDLDFALAVYPVDRAGNIGAARFVDVVDRPGAACGCAGAGSPTWLWLMALGAWRRRR